MSRYTSAIIMLIALSGIVGCDKSTDKSNLSPDGQVIDQLAKAGSDLSKEHPIEFFIYASSMDAAEKVATDLRNDGYKTNVERTAEGESWLVFSTKDIVPTEQTMVKIRAELEDIASSVGGEYDGWGTTIVK